jgi:uncharacterized membrane-anchored protein
MKKATLLIALFFSFALAFQLLNATVAAQKKDKKEEAPAIELEDPNPVLKEMKKIAGGLKFQTGTITLKDGLATLKLPETFRYLDPEQTETVLTELWGNPPSRQKSLGMLFPANVSPASPESWGVVISYEEDGYVKDDDAASINYNDLLKEMKESTSASSEERKKAGYEAIELVGWAEQPHYDKAAHKLYWAKELKFGDSPDHTLNYDIRALGRRGVLSLNAVAAMGQLPMVRTDMQQVLGFVDFNDGHRYGDYVAGTDKVAAYGIGALIAGKLMAKAGLFKLLLGLLVAGKKFVIVGAIAIGLLLKKLFTGGSKGGGSDDETISVTGANS